MMQGDRGLNTSGTGRMGCAMNRLVLELARTTHGHLYILARSLVSPLAPISHSKWPKNPRATVTRFFSELMRQADGTAMPWEQSERQTPSVKKPVHTMSRPWTLLVAIAS